MTYKHVKMYLKIAKTISDAGTCKRARTGAVIVNNGCIIGTGYNGSAKGEAHCLDKGCDMDNGHCVRCVHAETNAIINAARSGTSTVGSVMLCTHRPCHRCMRNIINSGIEAVFYIYNYPDERTDKLVKETGFIEKIFRAFEEVLS